MVTIDGFQITESMVSKLKSWKTLNIAELYGETLLDVQDFLSRKLGYDDKETQQLSGHILTVISLRDELKELGAVLDSIEFPVADQ